MKRSRIHLPRCSGRAEYDALPQAVSEPFPTRADLSFNGLSPLGRPRPAKPREAPVCPVPDRQQDFMESAFDFPDDQKHDDGEDLGYAPCETG